MCGDIDKGDIRMIHVYLDDFRTCPKGFVLANNADECKLLIDGEEINILSLDYDLGWNQPTGYEVVKHLIATRRFPQVIYLHTSSMFGRQQMYEALREVLPQHVQLFGRPISEDLLEQIAQTSTK